MVNFLVSSSVELKSALSKARNGDSIFLKSGTYSDISVVNLKFSSGITISSADKNDPARITDLLISGSSGISLQNVNLQPTAAAKDYNFQVRNSSNINIDSVHLVGKAGDAGYDHSPMMIRGSTNVAVTNSEFEHAWHGINLLGNTGVTIAGNVFHDLRTDGVRGGGNSSIVIKNNFFTDFHPKAGDHPDAIQFWTTNTTKSAENIEISGNTIYAGQGDPIQGIFMRDELGNLPYQNVSVVNNVIIGTMYNGIALDHLSNAQVANNVVAGLGDQKSWLRVTNPLGVSVTGNAATYFNFPESALINQIGNKQLPAVYDGGQSLLHQFSGQIAASLPSAYLTFDSFATLVSYTFQTSLASAPAETLVNGTGGDDRLAATNLGDTRIYAGAGNDTLTGSIIGANTMIGGSGDDTYIVRNAKETVIEQAREGNDTVNTYVNLDLGANVENLKVMVAGLTAGGNDLDNRITGSTGADILFGRGGADSMQGGEGNDILSGGAGDDSIRGEAGADFISGDEGADRLFGLAGNDTINGGAGNDQIEGGFGIDLLSGGSGKDVFIFRNGDLDGTTPATPELVTDFSRAEGDIIGISLMDAKIATATDDVFAWIGTKAFSGVAGQLRYVVIGGDALVSGDINGDGMADFTLELLGVTTLSAADFYL